MRSREEEQSFLFGNLQILQTVVRLTLTYLAPPALEAPLFEMRPLTIVAGAIITTLLSQSSVIAQELDYPVIVSFDSCESDVTTLNSPDRASIRFIQSPSCSAAPFNLEAVNSNCYKCSSSLLATNETQCGNLWTPVAYQITLVDQSSGQVLATEDDVLFGEGGSYFVTASCGSDGAAAPSILITTLIEPDDALEPFFIFFGLLVLFIFLSFTVPLIFEHFCGGIVISFFSTENSRVVFDNTDDANRTLSGNAPNPLTASLTSPLIQDDVETKEAGATSTTREKGGGGGGVAKMPRLKSLDTFRGFALIGMIFVNMGDGGYWFIGHSAWNGLTVADIFFPFFMWIMGCSMALSFVPIVIKGNSSYASLREWWRVVRRSLTLFAIGMFLSSHSLHFKTWRIPGVLQYFAFSYFITASTVLICLPLTRGDARLGLNRGASDNDKYIVASAGGGGGGGGGGIWGGQREGRGGGGGEEGGIREIWNAISSSPLLAYKWEWTIQLLVVIIYLSISLGVAAPGCPAGYNGPGGLYENSSHSQCTGGIHRYLDIKFFGLDHMYDEPTCTALYDCLAYDPEGLLGSFSACTLTYLGLMSGRVLIHYKDHWTRLRVWASFSFTCLLIAGCLCGFSQNGGVIPVNKNLWSTSFILISAGFGLVGLSFCYVTVDVWHIWSGAPLLFLGMNSIFIYCGQSVFAHYFPFYYVIDTMTHADILKRNVFGTFCWCAVAFYCFKIKFFVKV